jgi:DNA-binding protein HU-beta
MYVFRAAVADAGEKQFSLCVRLSACSHCLGGAKSLPCCEVGRGLDAVQEGKPVNKSQFIETLAAQFADNKKVASEALDAVVDTIAREVARGEKVAITGFGAFEKIVRPARKVRNPRTGERVRVKKSAVPKFRPGAEFKAVVSGDKKLPKPSPVKAVAKKSTSNTAATPAKKSTATRSASAKKTAAKSTPAKRATTTKSSPAKRTAAKSTAAKKSTAKSTTTKSTTARKTTTKSSPAKRTAAKSTTARKTTAKKTTAKSTPAKKTATKRTAAKRS